MWSKLFCLLQLSLGVCTFSTVLKYIQQVDSVFASVFVLLKHIYLFTVSKNLHVFQLCRVIHMIQGSLTLCSMRWSPFWKLYFCTMHNVHSLIQYGNVHSSFAEPAPVEPKLLSRTWAKVPILIPVSKKKKNLGNRSKSPYNHQ